MINFNKFIRMIKQGSCFIYSKMRLFNLFFLNLGGFSFPKKSSTNSSSPNYSSKSEIRPKNDMLDVFNSDEIFIETQVREILSLIRKEEEQREKVVEKKQIREKLNKVIVYKLNKFKSVIEIIQKINREQDKLKKDRFNDCLLNILQFENREIMKKVFQELLEKQKRKNSIEISYTPSPEPFDFEMIEMVD